jgi:hypothetical protein
MAKKAGDYKHGLLVTGYTSPLHKRAGLPNILLSAHTNDRENVPLSFVDGIYAQSEYEMVYWKVFDIF